MVPGNTKSPKRKGENSHVRGWIYELNCALITWKDEKKKKIKGHVRCLRTASSMFRRVMDDASFMPTRTLHDMRHSDQTVTVWWVSTVQYRIG